jgi:CelD/BcsL family acetyltransferase involved in cellulose biosynthesis
MDTEIVRGDADFDALAEAWGDLHRRAPNALPFQSYDWNRSWWTHFSQQSFFRKDERFILTFRLEGRLVGVLPMVRSRFGLGPLTIYHYLRPFGSDPNLTEIRAPLVEADVRLQVLERCIEWMHEQRPMLALHQIAAPEGLIRPLLEGSGNYKLVANRVIEDYVLELEGPWDSFLKSRKRNIRESIRHCYNSLSRDGLKHELRVLSDSSQVLAHLDHFFELHQGRSKVRHSVKHPDYFAADRHQSFIRTLIERSAPTACPVHLFQLTLNDQVVAVRLGFVTNGELYCYYSGYDTAYARYSVMTTLVTEMMRWAIDKGVKRVNLSVGRDVSKTRWGPAEIRIDDCHFIRNTALNRFFSAIVLTLKRARRALFSGWAS